MRERPGLCVPGPRFPVRESPCPWSPKNPPVTMTMGQSHFPEAGPGVEFGGHRRSGRFEANTGMGGSTLRLATLCPDIWSHFWGHRLPSFLWVLVARKLTWGAPGGPFSGIIS